MGPLWLDLSLGFLIGLSLGLLGGGGSNLTVPALVYLVGQSPQAAVTTSLVIVGANSAVGAMFHQRSGTFNKITREWLFCLEGPGWWWLICPLGYQSSSPQPC